MSDQPTFESRLAAALQRRADAAPIAVDASAVTHAAAMDRASMGARLFGVPGWRTARLVLVATLLAVLITASLLIGSRLVSPEPKLSLGRLVPAGEMTTVRNGPLATLLADGRVLLVAGDQNDRPTAELFDPKTGTSVRTGSLIGQRFGMTAAPLTDGRVLVVGGLSMGSEDFSDWAIRFGEVYDPATETFTRTGDLVQPRGYLWTTVTLPDGRVLIAGGQVPDVPPGATSGPNRTLSSVELYDPRLGVFVPGGSLLVPRTANTLTLLGDGKVLVTGGWGLDGPIASAEVYDPATGTSALVGDMTTARAYHTAVALADGRVLILGGNGPGTDGPALDSVEIFDPAGGRFQAVGRLVTERSGANAVRLRDGSILVAGGNNRDGNPRTVESFDPAAGTSVVVGRVDPGQDDGNSFGVTTTLLADGSVLLAGGNGVDIERFDPTQPAEPPRSGPSAVEPDGFVAVDGAGQGHGVLRTGHTATLLLDGRVLIAGGTDGGTSPVLASAEIFDPATGTTSATGPLTVPRSGHAAAPLADGRVLIVGGLEAADPAVAWSSAELYDPATGTFEPIGVTTIAKAPGRRFNRDGGPAAVRLPDGRVLVVGWDPSEGQASPRAVQVYEPASGDVTTVELPAGTLVRNALSAVVLQDGRVLVLDGNADGLQAEVYDPLADAWQLGATTNGREAFTTTILPDGRVLIAGGKAGSNSSDDESLSTAETWDPVSGAFSAAGDMGAGRADGSATLLPDGRVLIAGGNDHRHTTTDANGLPNSYPPPQLWDPASGTFGAAGSMVAPRAGHTATMLDDGHVLIVGGITRSPDRDQADPPAAELYVGR